MTQIEFEEGLLRAEPRKNPETGGMEVFISGMKFVPTQGTNWFHLQIGVMAGDPCPGCGGKYLREPSGIFCLECLAGIVLKTNPITGREECFSRKMANRVNVQTPPLLRSGFVWENGVLGFKIGEYISPFWVALAKSFPDDPLSVGIIQYWQDEEWENNPDFLVVGDWMFFKARPIRVGAIGLASAITSLRKFAPNGWVTYIDHLTTIYLRGADHIWYSNRLKTEFDRLNPFLPKKPSRSWEKDLQEVCTGWPGIQPWLTKRGVL